MCILINSSGESRFGLIKSITKLEDAIRFTGGAFERLDFEVVVGHRRYDLASTLAQLELGMVARVQVLGWQRGGNLWNAQGCPRLWTIVYHHKGLLSGRFSCQALSPAVDRRSGISIPRSPIGLWHVLHHSIARPMMIKRLQGDRTS